MEPHYDLEKRLLINAKRAGDVVVVQLRDPTCDGEELKQVPIKQLVRRRSGVVERWFGMSAQARGLDKWTAAG